MPILSGDIKLVASQVMNDVPEGGGAPTATVIVDGVSNAIFPDISETDRAGGRVSLRKLHVSVQTLDTDTYMGSNMIVAEPPEDPNISITLFTTNSTFDRRTSASAMVESYLIRGSVWGGFLLENHVAGQRVIQILQRPTLAKPTIGRTLVLVFDEGLVTEVIQYVRIIRVQSVIQQYIFDSSNTYQAMVCTCDISDALRTPFPGTGPNRDFVAGTGKTRIRDTSVADAGSYFGVAPLAQAALLGVSKIQATSVYTQLVPSAATEKSELDVTPSATRSITLAASPRRVEVGVAPHTMRIKLSQENRSFSYVQMLSPVPAPGTIEVSFLALGEWYSLLDDGVGTLTGQGTGTINYLTGSISVTLPALPDSASSLIFAWGAKTEYTNVAADTGYRMPEFSFSLEKMGIDRGSLVITWLSGGVLKTATDATGPITGDATGYLAPTTGHVAFTPSAMIDAGGQFNLSYTWSTVLSETKAGLIASAGGMVTFTTAEIPVEGSVMVEWFCTRTATATSGAKMSGGSSTKQGGSSSGSSSSSSTELSYNVTPAYQNIYHQNFPATASGASSNSETSSTVTSDTSSGSSSKYSQTSMQSSKQVITIYKTITENGVGGFLNAMGIINYGGKSVTLKVVDPSSTDSSYSSDTESGVDFSAAQSSASGSSSGSGSSGSSGGSGGSTSITAANTASVSSTSGGSTSSQGGSYASASTSEVFDSTALLVTYRTGASAATAHSQTYTPAAVSIDLAPYTSSRVVPGSVQFTWMGHVYQDLEGVLYRDPSGASVGTVSGSINYATGLASLSSYVVAGSPSALSIGSLWISKGEWTTSKIFCRTPSAPIKPSGFVMSVVDVAGLQLIATADNNGQIAGNHCLGEIDYQTGVVDMIFGDLVLDSALSAAEKLEWWYAKAFTQITADFKVWRPWPVDPNTLRYNVVSYFYLPLDANLLGIDPVRLPQDGRVSIFRPGGFAVVGHTGKITTTATVSVAATGTITVASPVADAAFTVMGIQYVLKATPIALQTPVQVQLDASDSVTATNMATAVTTKSGTLVSASATGTVVTVTAVAPGLIGNTYTLVGNVTTLVASAATLTGGTGIDCGRQRLSRVRVLGFDGSPIHLGYSTDLDAGTVTFTDVTGYSQPVTVHHRIEDMAVVSDVQITGQIGFTRQLTHDYPLTEPPTSFISSAMVSGDLKARVSVIFDQATWTNVWQDAMIGAMATATFNDVLAPIVVTNKGAVTERWALTFTSTTAFTLAGEHVGVIATGSINANLSPVNPATGVPYFSLPALGWGIGWSTGNVLRFNTVGAMAPVWVVRTVQQGPNTGVQHSFTLLSRGDVDRP